MNDRWRAKFAWSNSRQNSWDTCRRQYFFNYIAPWEPRNSLTEQLWTLKKLTRLIFWKGSLIHDVVATQIKRVKMGMEMSMKTAELQIDAEVKGVMADPAAKGFVEIVNGGEITQDDLEASRLEANRQIENFMTIVWPKLSDYEILSVEEYLHFDLGGIPVTVKLDLELKTFDDFYEIKDWKTGKEKPDEASGSSQLGVYILSSVERRNIPESEISASLCYLKTGAEFQTSRTDEQLDETAAAIIKSSNEMLAVKSENDFPASPKQWRCRDCQFATICDEGKGFIGG